MSFPPNRPSGPYQNTGTARFSGNSVTLMSFPESRSSLWDSRLMGEKLRLQLCSHRKPQLVLMEKTLRLAQHHVRNCNKPRLHCFFLGSLSVDQDEEGVTVTLDRFDPGRDQDGASGRLPSTVVPGDIVVPFTFSMQMDTPLVTMVQSEAELHHSFKVLQLYVSSRQMLDLSQLLKVKGHVICSPQLDATAFTLSWSAVCPDVVVEAHPVQAVPVIPTALVRSLTSLMPPQLPHSARCQRGFLTMNQTRKLLLILDSDPKASSLPLVGVWLSGITHVCNPQVWAFCLRFLFSSALQDRVLLDSSSFLLVVFSVTHRAPQFYHCRPIMGPGLPHLDYQLLTATESTTLFQQVSAAEGQTLRFQFASDGCHRQVEIFREAQISFSSAPSPAAHLSISDHDSGVEDEDLSPRPSPSPHFLVQQVKRVQPSVPELSLLVDASFTPSDQERVPSRTPLPAGTTSEVPADTNSAPPPGQKNSTSAAPRSAHLHSTPNSNLDQPCTCCHVPSYDFTPISVPQRCTLILHMLPPLSTVLLPVAVTPFLLMLQHLLSLLLLLVATRIHLLLPITTLLHLPSPPFILLLLPPTPTLLLLLLVVRFLSNSAATPPPVFRTAGLPPLQWTHPSVPSGMVADSPAPLCVRRASSLPAPLGVVPSDAYQLLLQQDQQLRLLQAQVQMLLQVQGNLQVSSHHAETQTPRNTASVAVGTGASLFWGDYVHPVLCQEGQDPPPPSPGPLSSSNLPSASSSRTSSHSDPPVSPKPVSRADSVASVQGVACSPPGQHSVSGLQSPVLGESASMYGPADDQQRFYRDLMSQLTSRLQESESKQEEEEPTSRRVSVGSDPAFSSSSSTRKQQSSRGDPVISATLQQLRQLGVDVDQHLCGADRSRHRVMESASTLMCINPAAVLSRLSVSEPADGTPVPECSADLSLEANAIALRYLSDSQLCQLLVGGRAPRPSVTVPVDTVLYPSNMSLASRRYMRRYGLIEEHSSEDEQEVTAQKAPAEALNRKLLPQGQLNRDLKPKTQLLACDAKRRGPDKENRSPRLQALGRTSTGQPEGSVGNILDLSRLRQLPKLF
ncbi:LOW QUALITY PROTEIN: SCL-interrupting locus protein homolog [Thalassophryne amazonica]|uniref:LOW QUALITY PROTEIN: SCL-interrupting locus protein homolog n=1 Tax=Thalassophryne amazonica TaxID=390379 RepID=UPI001471C545|nr:LOW QUALITY PROTEIN: SCL-interrupting locus protein homolog [Thalassophryne amazonica]